MPPRSLEQRVTILEQQMQELKELPARVTGLESQVLQLRGEMRDGFSAIRSEFRAESQETSTFMRALYEDAIARIATMGEGRK